MMNAGSVGPGNIMIKFVGEVTSERLRRFAIQDPELLPLLARDIPRAKGAGRQELVRRFCAITSDIRTTKTWKVTRPDRLRVTERLLTAHIEPRGSTIRVLDVGASSGTTSYQLHESLQSHFKASVRTDLVELFTRIRRYRLGPAVEYRAPGGIPLLFRIGPVGLRLSLRKGARRITERLVRSYLSLDTLRRRLRYSGEMSLLDPRVEESGSMHVFERDCFVRHEAFVARYDAIRASNILNRSYFADQRLAAAMDHLFAYLRPGGCLVVSRNLMEVDEGIEQGSVWGKRGDRLVLLEDFGGGSEIKHVTERSDDLVWTGDPV